MSEPSTTEPPKPTSLGRRVLTVLAYVVVLCGPLLATELWVKGQVRELIPHMRHWGYRADLGLLLLAKREACPDALVLGASMSERSLTPANLRGQDLGGGVVIDDPFTFAMAGVRATNMLEMWLAVVDRGCVPEAVFIEANPIVLNVAKGGADHDRPFLSMRMSARMPEGFNELRGYDFAELAEFWTNDRLFIHRKRDRVVLALQTALEWRGKFDVVPAEGAEELEEIRVWDKDLPLDGRVKGTPNRSLKGKAYKREERKRRNMQRRGRFIYRYGPVEGAALLALVDDARSRGTRAILHSPPVTPLYPEILAKVDEADSWASVEAELEAAHGEVWFDSMREHDRYPPKYFHDYVHLNRKGARRYAKDLIAAARERADQD